VRRGDFIVSWDETALRCLSGSVALSQAHAALSRPMKTLQCRYAMRPLTNFHLYGTARTVRPSLVIVWFLSLKEDEAAQPVGKKAIMWVTWVIGEEEEEAGGDLEKDGDGDGESLVLGMAIGGDGREGADRDDECGGDDDNCGGLIGSPLLITTSPASRVIKDSTPASHMPPFNPSPCLSSPLSVAVCMSSWS
jgi:hypothetical protein